MPGDDTTLLEVSELRVSVPGRVLVDRLDMTLQRGEFIAVLGRNGTGKTLSLLTLAGLREADRGTISLGGEAIDALFWCVGSWGHLYPLAGHHLQHTSIPRNTSLLASRALAKLHRRGQARRHMGDDAVCNPVIEPFLPKTQYQMSVFHPVPEATSKHPTGRLTFRWGEDRMIPGSGEDMVYLVWRWNDCCRQVVCFGP